MSNFRISGVAINDDSIAPATITDCAASCGTAGQVLSSTGTALQWITPSGGGGSLAEATVAGTLFGWGNTDKGAVSLGFGAACCIGLRSYAGGNSDENIAIGIRPLSEQTGAYISANVVIGDRALYGRTGDERIGCNIAIGAYALNRYCGRNLCHNVGIGYCTGGFWCNTGSTTGCTVAIGSFSGAPKYFSLAIGFSAIPGVGGECNLAVGHCAGHSLATTATRNVMIGHCAGTTGTVGNICGSNNVLIGISANPSSPTVSGEVTIRNGSVSARFQGAASAWSFVSDERDKTNITALPVGLGFVNQLQPRQFEWAIRNADTDHGKPAAGFIAQEVDNVVESHNAQYLNLVDKNNPDQYSLAQANIIPVLVKAIQELSAKVDSLQTKLDTLI